MTYKRFKEEVESMGLECWCHDDWHVYATKDEDICGVVSRETQYVVRIPFGGFHLLSEQQKHDLFQLVTSLAETPLEERGEIVK